MVERFEGRPSLELTGYSVSVLDAEADLSRQTWADDQGSYLALTGGTEGDTFVLHMSAVRGGVPVELRDRAGQLLLGLGALSRCGRDVVETAWEIAYTRTA